MKHSIIISIIAVAIFSAYCYSSNAKTKEKTVSMAATATQEGVCVGGDMEGLVCMK